MVSLSFSPLKVRIEYIIEHVRDGLTFVGCDAGDMRYPHAYTTHSPLPGAACCLFPTLDGIHERWTWEIEVTVPKTIGDIEKVSSPLSQVNGNGATANGVNVVNGTHESLEDEDMQIDEDSELDITVVCSGNYKDEVRQTIDWVLFRIFMLTSRRRSILPSLGRRFLSLSSLKRWRHSISRLQPGRLSGLIFQSIAMLKLKRLWAH